MSSSSRPPAPDVELLPTDDGSVTLRRMDDGVSYRSTSGAHTEVEHVFVHGSGLTSVTSSTWTVVEFGFGGGLSFRTAAQAARAAGAKLRFISVEHQPVAPQFVVGDDVDAGLARLALGAVKQNAWATAHDDRVHLEVFVGAWMSAPLPTNVADAVFFDPFGPDDNPDAWDVPHLQKAADALHDAGVLATYSAAGRVRRAMRDAGLMVARGPGPGRKREVTYASKSLKALEKYEVLQKLLPTHLRSTRTAKAGDRTQGAPHADR